MDNHNIPSETVENSNDSFEDRSANSLQDQQNTTKSEPYNLSFNITRRDAHTLTIGFFHRIGEYFNKNSNKGSDEEILNTEASVIKRLLLKLISENFHGDDVQDHNDSLCVVNDNINKEKMAAETAKKKLSQTAKGSKHQLDETDGSQDVNTKMKDVKKLTKKSKVETQISTNEPNAATTQIKENDNYPHTSEVCHRVTRSFTTESSNKSKNDRKRRLLNTNQSSTLKPKKRGKVVYVYHDDRITKVAASIRCALTGEDYKTVAKSLKEEAINKCIYGNEKVTKKAVLTATAAESPGASKINKKRTTLRKKNIETETISKEA